MQPSCSLVLAFLAMLAPVASAKADPKWITVGGTAITAPAPPGYVDSRGTVAADIGAYLAKLSATASDNVVVLISRRDVSQLKAGRLPSMDRYFVLGTPRSLATRSLSPEEFAAVRNLLATQSQALAEEAQPKVQAALDAGTQQLHKASAEESVRLTAGYMKELGVVHNREDSICTLSVSPLTTETDSQKETALVGVAALVAWVRNKVVTVNIYSSYKSPKDTEWLKQQCGEWSRRLQQANP